MGNGFPGVRNGHLAGAAEVSARRRGPIKTAACLKCGTHFTQRGSTRRVYCSRPCWYKRNSLPEGKRRCVKCGELKNQETDFGKMKNSCKPCVSNGTKDYVARLKSTSEVKWLAYVTARAMAHPRCTGPAPKQDELIPMFERAVAGAPCPYCSVRLSKMNVSLDHITPVSRGGTNHLDNVHIVCMKCNSMKGNIGHRAFIRLLQFAGTINADDRRIFEARLLAGNTRFTRKSV